MFCAKCNNELGDCVCPDIDDRLRALDMVILKWCLTCDKHYARCKCAEPIFGIRTDGRTMPTTMEFP